MNDDEYRKFKFFSTVISTVIANLMIHVATHNPTFSYFIQSVTSGLNETHIKKKISNNQHNRSFDMTFQTHCKSDLNSTLCKRKSFVALFLYFRAREGVDRRRSLLQKEERDSATRIADFSRRDVRRTIPMAWQVPLRYRYDLPCNIVPRSPSFFSFFFFSLLITA